MGELRRRTPLTRTGQLSPTSTRRRAENRERAAVLASMTENDPWCTVRLPGLCTGRAEDGHEILTRARGGSITDPDNIILVCRACHTYVTAHPVWADEQGWTQPSGDGAGGGIRTT